MALFSFGQGSAKKSYAEELDAVRVGMGATVTAGSNENTLASNSSRALPSTQPAGSAEQPPEPRTRTTIAMM